MGRCASRAASAGAGPLRYGPEVVCCHLYAPVEGGEDAFAVDTNAITFGRGCTAEVGAAARSLGAARVAVFTDPRVRALPLFDRVVASLAAAKVDAVVYAECAVEPTDRSFEAAARFSREARVDGYVSVGGGSVIDTAKAANLYATHPADFLAYVNAPVGEGRPVPGALRPHIACPTTAGTGSECTGIAVFDLVAEEVKTGIAHRALRPTQAFIDPEATDSLPSFVVAAAGFDVLCHALESYTARPFTRRRSPQRGGPPRPMSQGANPWSDMGCREALRLCGQHLERAVVDAEDREAREKMMWASTLAGIAFGNAGVHLPHGMAYSVAGMVERYRPPDYPGDEPMVPHGVSVVVNAPAVFAATAPTGAARHLEAAGLLGADVVGATGADAGEILSDRLARLMRACRVPNGLTELGYGDAHVPGLTRGALAQQRLLKNAPVDATEELVAQLYRDAMRCW